MKHFMKRLLMTVVDILAIIIVLCVLGIAYIYLGAMGMIVALCVCSLLFLIAQRENARRR